MLITIDDARIVIIKSYLEYYIRLISALLDLI